jgi:RHH-type transcriptional regulator, proline utilization regulon repressor / proline dehydrogenase / delta 1-pyrroline-5-carboxylate dehydrogenase
MRGQTVHGRRNRRIMELGTQYWQAMRGDKPGIFDQRKWHGRLLDQVLKDDGFKIDAFRFIDVLPVLQSNEAIASHVRDYLLGRADGLPVAVRSALTMAAGGIVSPLATRVIRANVTAMARRFICEGEGDKPLKVFAKLAGENLTFTADILGEATVSDAEAERRLQQHLEFVKKLGKAGEQLPENPVLHRSPSGPLPLANISVKISAFDPYPEPADHAGSTARLRERLLPLLRLAREKNVFINFDLEQWAVHSITYGLFEELACHPDLKDWPHIGLTVQSYLKSGEQDCDCLLALSRKRGTPFTVRLVKGAYWDYEVARARSNGFACPVFTGKGLTDANFENITVKLIDNHQLVTPAFASHNLRSLVHAMVVAEEKGLERTGFEVQMLHGMAEPLRRVVAADGYRVRIYVPIGDLLPGMAYLVRRLLENTSGSGFLRRAHHDGEAVSALLEPPALEPEPVETDGIVQGDIDSPFGNAGLLDFCEQKVRDEFAEAVAAVKLRLPLDVPLVTAGRSVMSENPHSHVSPNDPDLVVARVSRATTVQAEEALQVSSRAFPAWRDTPLRDRAELLEGVAGLLEQDRFRLAALQTHEAGKPWQEADADVAEAIDFCRYYARRAIPELGPARLEGVAGETNVLLYAGRGPTVIIAPWNFPLAILCGMTTAALAAGNTVLMKPSSAAAAVAHALYGHLLAAGFAPEVVQFLPGAGEETGRFLAAHSAVSQIAFTGSREVGLAIIEQAGKTRAGQEEIKRVVCEMGGKNAVIVDEDADPDAALKGVVQSAFGYAGQKCSACSRLILVGSAYEPFMSRLREACASLPLAPATDPRCRLGPVIDRGAYERLHRLIADPPEGAELFFKGEVPETGLFVPPVVFTVTDAQNPLMQEELFGPVLTVIRAADFSEALDMANSTEFALTGAVYSRSPGNLAMAGQRFRVGNLYLNRGCTGALVGLQPFGGFGMSGLGTKAGGPGYLRNFANPRCVTENTVRSGFIPDLQV